MSNPQQKTASTQPEYYFDESGVRSRSSHFSELYVLHFDEAFKYAMKLKKCEHEASDIAQEAFANAFEQFHRFEYRSQFSSWLIRITHNLCISGIRKQVNDPLSRALTNATEEGEAQLAKLANCDYEGDQSECYERMKDAIATLSTYDQELLNLKYKEGLSISELANIVHLSEGALKMKLKRIRVKVKKVFASGE